MQNLPEIHDIYIPDGVSVFPLAYGWWVILATIICGIILFKFIIWSIKTSKKHYALNKLKKIDVTATVDAAVKMSELLRRICNVKYKKATALYGQEWIDFLNEHTSLKISGDAAKLLMFAPFMNKEDKTYQPQSAIEIKDFCHHWIGANL
jgi:hypothetical protein